MKVLIINSLYPPQSYGGAEKSVSLLAESLSHRGHEVSVVSLHEKDMNLFDYINNVRVYRLSIRNIYFPFSQDRQPDLRSRLRFHLNDVWNIQAGADVGLVLDTERPDVVHTNNLTGFSTAIWRECRRRGHPVVHTLRDYSLICEKSTMFRRGRTCTRRCIDCVAFTIGNKRESRTVQSVVSNSQFVLNLHRTAGFFPGVPGHVVYNIAEAFDRSIEPEQPGNDLVFGFIGRIEPEKGIEVVLKACEQLPPTGWRLNIAGRGDDIYVADLKERYRLPQINWLGFYNSSDFYKSIDISIVASIWPEPLPRTLIESMSAGRSTICARSGGIPEIASMSRLVGMYEPMDHDALATTMQRCMDETEKWKHVEDVDLHTLNKFSPDVVAESYVKLYAEACRGVK